MNLNAKLSHPAAVAVRSFVSAFVVAKCCATKWTAPSGRTALERDASTDSARSPDDAARGATVEPAHVDALAVWQHTGPAAATDSTDCPKI